MATGGGGTSGGGARGDVGGPLGGGGVDDGSGGSGGGAPSSSTSPSVIAGMAFVVPPKLEPPTEWTLSASLSPESLLDAEPGPSRGASAGGGGAAVAGA